MALYVSELNSAAEQRRPSVVLAHGFTQNSRCWSSFSTELAQTRRLKLVDLPGHGQSEHDDADLVTSGDLLAEAGGEAAIVGYSMGGRIALHTALQYRSQVSKLILIGVNPGLEAASDREQRRTNDTELALQLRREGLDVFLRKWLHNPMFGGLSEEAACLKHRLVNRLSGLEATLLTRSVGCQVPLWERLGELTMPVLLISGQADQKYGLLNERAAGLIPQAQTCTIPGGHAVHLQNPKAVAAAVNQFIGG